MSIAVCVNAMLVLSLLVCLYRSFGSAIRVLMAWWPWAHSVGWWVLSGWLGTWECFSWCWVSVICWADSDDRWAHSEYNGDIVPDGCKSCCCCVSVIGWVKLSSLSRSNSSCPSAECFLTIFLCHVSRFYCWCVRRRRECRGQGWCSLFTDCHLFFFV